MHVCVQVHNTCLACIQTATEVASEADAVSKQAGAPVTAVSAPCARLLQLGQDMSSWHHANMFRPHSCCPHTCSLQP